MISRTNHPNYARGYSLSSRGHDLPDIAGSYATIKMFAPVDLGLRLEYLRARGKALAYGGEHTVEAFELYERVCGALRAANLRKS